MCSREGGLYPHSLAASHDWSSWSPIPLVSDWFGHEHVKQIYPIRMKHEGGRGMWEKLLPIFKRVTGNYKSFLRSLYIVWRLWCREVREPSRNREKTSPREKAFCWDEVKCKNKLTKKGPHTKPDKLREACMVGLTNSETECNHVGWSEHWNVWLKAGHDE